MRIQPISVQRILNHGAYYSMAYRPPPTPKLKVTYLDIQDVTRAAQNQLPTSWAVVKIGVPLILGKYCHTLGGLEKRITIDEDLTARATLGEVPVKDTWSMEQMTLNNVIEAVDKLYKCIGINDPAYQDIQYNQTFRFLSSQVFPDGKVASTSVLRSNGCSAVSSINTRCEGCSNVLPYFEKKVAAASQDKIPHPNTPLSTLSKRDLINVVKAGRENIRTLQREVNRLTHEAKVQGVQLSKDIQDGIISVMDEPQTHNHELMELFWAEQKKAFEKDPRGMRWHPMMVRFAIYLHYQSPRAYEALRETGVLRLPNKSTLRDYTNFYQPGTGFQAHVFQELKEMTRTLPPHKRFVALLHDEMTVKSDLVYDRRSGDIIGFINPTSWTFEKDMTANIATHAMVFMVIGISHPLKYSIGYFPTRSSTADEMFPILWDAIAYLELVCQLKVISSTSDKASSNQKLYRMHKVGKEDIVYKARNMYAAQPRSIYFFSDAPHLIKTLRNNLHKSRSGGTRCLWNNGQHLWWSHVFKVYQDDLSRQLYRTKLTFDHVNLTPASTLSVRLAAQVLSATVGRVMEAYYGQEMQETAKFIRLCDRFFDCLNVRSQNEHARTRKSDMAPYRSIDDERFNFLKVTFLGYINDWKKSTESREGFSKVERAKMFLSLQTYEGIVMTIHAFVEATQFLLSQGVPYVLSQDFCQDALEEHFGRHRGLAGRSTNPTIHTFGYQENKIRIQRSLAFQLCPKGNTVGKKTEREPVIISSSPLKKLKRH